VMRFNKSLSAAQEDIRVKQRFVNDVDCLATLLARMIEGARSPSFVNGVHWELLPTRFALETMDAFDEVDHIGSFLLWMSEQGHLAKVEDDVPASHCAKASDLHGWYTHWVRKHGDRADREGQLNMRDFGQALRTRGWESTMAQGTRWRSYRLASTTEWL